MDGIYIKFVGIFLLNILSCSVGVPVGTCPSLNRELDDYLTDSNNCSIFYKCDWGVAVKFECASSLHFNPEWNGCDWPVNVNCKSNSSTTSTTTTTTTTTIVPVDGCLKTNCPYLPAPPANVTFFPHDTNCQRYCMCDWYSSVHDMPCPDGLHWNSELNTCDWPWTAGCNNSIPPTTTTTTTTTTTVAPPPSPPPPPPTTTTTTTTTTATPPLIKGCLKAKCPYLPAPPTNVTFFPHDGDCKRYCMCDWYSTVHDMACSDGLYWNSELATCDWPSRAGCDKSYPAISTNEPEPTKPIDTTTETITTTEVSLDDGCSKASCPFYPAPPANVTFFPHNFDCERYCMCDWFGKAHDMPCPSGLHWHVGLDTCDWPWDAGCIKI